MTETHGQTWKQKYDELAVNYELLWRYSSDGDEALYRSWENQKHIWKIHFSSLPMIILAALITGIVLGKKFLTNQTLYEYVVIVVWFGILVSGFMHGRVIGRYKAQLRKDLALIDKKKEELRGMQQSDVPPPITVH